MHDVCIREKSCEKDLRNMIGVCSTTVTRIDLSCNELTEKGGEMVKLDNDDNAFDECHVCVVDYDGGGW